MKFFRILIVNTGFLKRVELNAVKITLMVLNIIFSNSLCGTGKIQRNLYVKISN